MSWVTASCVVAALVSGETFGVAMGAVFFVLAMIAIGKLTMVLAVNLLQIARATWQQGRWSDAIEIYRWVPVICLVAILAMVTIAVGRHVVEESTANGHQLIRWGWLASMLGWIRLTDAEPAYSEASVENRNTVEL